ncbi:MAG: ATP-binding protein [Proteobacteria bacterium]|nr:ATP-binding protein [Pseudomonadota bacterium]
MSEQAALRVVNPSRARAGETSTDWGPSSAPVVIGKDVLELLSTSMYVDAMTIYREYVQNAADAVDEARDKGLLGDRSAGKVDITVDATARLIRIQDNGTGIGWPEFAERLSNLGASTKRGTAARGFRGVGRLAGLGYCQELIFRSRVDGDSDVSELRWDCRALKTALRSARHTQPIATLIQDIVSVRRVPAERQPKRFFEVELRGVIRHRNDRLLSQVAVGEYLAQVAPLPFAPDFKFGEEIVAALRPHVRLGDLEVRINGAEEPLYRPHRNRVEVGEGQFDKVTDLEIRELTGVDGGTSAIAWILHHGYTGALPNRALVKGFRFRAGNMQVGDNNLLEELFPEPRFNGWAIGEIHVLDGKVVPNGRRDHFEQSVHYDNLINQITPSAREIARRCRQSSIGRKWIREFELHSDAALSHAKACARGGLSRAAKRTHSDAVAKALKAVKKVVTTRHIGDDTRTDLSAQAAALEARVTKLMGSAPAEKDPLEAFKPQVRSAYQNVISLIYEFASNSAAAATLVEKILSRIGQDITQSGASGPKKKLTKKSKHR